MIRQHVAIGVGVIALLLASACGSGPARSSTSSESESESETLPDVDPDRTPSIPPTTVPRPVPDYACDDPRLVAENLLLERRQGAPASNCAAPDPWLDSSDDFVDFVLDTATDVGSRPNDTLRFVARYRTSDDTSDTRAETLRFEQQPDGTWEMVEHRHVDVTSALADARVVADTYFTALADGDHRVAAELLATSRTPERPDLDRLEDDGLLDERTVDGITAALDEWCDGAACERPEDVRYEITADHLVRIVATYEVGPTGFEVVFDTDGTSVVGIPPLL